jgi:hypothetical protein
MLGPAHQGLFFWGSALGSYLTRTYAIEDQASGTISLPNSLR